MSGASIPADVHFVLRSLRREPLFCLAVIALLTLGLGVSAASFGVVDALLLRSLPVREPANLYRIVTVRPNLGPRSDLPLQYLDSLRRHSRRLTGFIAWTDFNVTATVNGTAQRIRAGAVSGNYFEELGITPSLGRLLNPADDRPDSPRMVVLSHAYWRRAFQSDPSVVGRTLRLRDQVFTISGVMPPAFTDLAIDTAPDVRISIQAALPLQVEEIYRQVETFYVDIGARLAPGASVEQARQEAQSLHDDARAADVHPDRWDRDIPLQLESLRHGVSAMRRQFGASAVTLLAGAAFLLLMICANVATLLLMRTLARARELAVRQALGASRLRLSALVGGEALVLGLAGFAGGVLLATALLRFALRAIPAVRLLDATSLPLAITFSLDGRVLLFTAALALVSTLGVSLASSWWAAQRDFFTTLRSERATGSGRARSALAGLQVALCTVLLACGAMLFRTYLELQRLHPGFDRDRVVNFSLAPGAAGYTAAQADQLRRRLLAEVRTLPGVENAAWSGRGVMRGTGIKTTVAPEGAKAPRSDFLNTSLHVVSPEYFETMGLRLLAGRGLREQDAAVKEKPRPVVVNEAFLRRFFPDRSGPGARFGTGVDVVVQADFEVAGIVSDARYRSLREPVPPTVYLPLTDPAAESILVVRAFGDPASLIAAVRARMHAIDPRLPLFDIHTLKEEVDHSLWRERLVAGVSLALALAAALLAGAGLYALLAYAVVQRSREIGIRCALGASPAAILLWLARGLVVLLAVGTLAGVGAAVLLRPYMESLLTSRSALDMPAGLALGAFLLFVVSLAYYVPARRALRIPTATLLRSE